mmetsp:Transcript_17777/g.34220  ORF Transcript_17777/g.34220 Transcript_17777/m.34220 type:complete len:266 (-) Transcript_17777:52-849(-)
MPLSLPCWPSFSSMLPWGLCAARVSTGGRLSRERKGFLSFPTSSRPLPSSPSSCLTGPLLSLFCLDGLLFRFSLSFSFIASFFVAFFPAFSFFFSFFLAFTALEDDELSELSSSELSSSLSESSESELSDESSSSLSSFFWPAFVFLPPLSFLSFLSFFSFLSGSLFVAFATPLSSSGFSSSFLLPLRPTPSSAFVAAFCSFLILRFSCFTLSFASFASAFFFAFSALALSFSARLLAFSAFRAASSLTLSCSALCSMRSSLIFA